MADKVHNLRSIVQDHGRVGERLWDRFTGKRNGTLWYYAELLEVYRDRAPARCAGLVEEMEGLYRQLLSQMGESSQVES